MADRDLELHVDDLSLHADDVDLHALPPWGGGGPCDDARPALLRVPETPVADQLRTTPSTAALLTAAVVFAIIVVVTVLVLL